MNLSIRASPKRIILLSIVTTLIFYLLYLAQSTLRTAPAHHVHNAAYTYTPQWVHGTLNKILPVPQLSPPTIFDGILSSTPMEWWEVPQPSNDTHDDAVVLLHVFSTPQPHSRQRRDLIRQHSTLKWIPEGYRHLVEVKFVVGYHDPDSFDEQAEKEERELEEEMTVHGDIIRLEGLVHGDNMNNGKTWEWIRWVVKESTRRGQWVFKCDDDVSDFSSLISYKSTDEN